MPTRTSARLVNCEIMLVEELQKIFSRQNESQDSESNVADGEFGLGSFLEWQMLPAILRLDPSWPHHDVWCDGVSFFSMKIPRLNSLRAQGYSWWLPTDQKGAGKMSGVGYTEPIELEMSLNDSESPPRVDYSIRLWANGLCHHLTHSGIAVAPLHSVDAIKPDIAGLVAVIKDQQADDYAITASGRISARFIAAAMLEKFAPPGESLLAELLNDQDVEVRRAAIYGLGQKTTVSQAEVSLAVKALQDADLQMRCLAVRALWQCAQANEAFLPELKLALPVLLEMFRLDYDDYRDWRMPVSELAEEILTRLRDPDQQVVQAMVEALSNEKRRLRAARVLCQLGSPPEQAIPIFMAALQHEDADWKTFAAFSLWRFGIDKGEAFIEMVRKIEDVEVSCAAARLLDTEERLPLRLLESKSVVPVLTTILQERADARAWSAAALALARLYPRESDEESRRLLASNGPAFLTLMSYKDWATRSNAIQTLGAMGADARPAIPVLLAFIHDESEDSLLQRQALEALIEIKPDAETIVLLFDYARRDDDSIASTPMKFGLHHETMPLLKLLGADAVPVLVKTLSALPAEDEIPLCFDHNAFELLEQIGEPAVSGLIELTEHPRWKNQAIQSLGKTASVSSIPRLIDRLRDESCRVRADAAEALGNLGVIAAESIPALCLAIDDPDLSVCAQAVWALERIGSASIPTLLAAIDGADDFALGWIAAALGEIGNAAAVPALQKLLFHNDSTVRYFSSNALQKIG